MAEVPRGPSGRRSAAIAGFDVPSFVAALREQGVTPHVAQKVKGSAIDVPIDPTPGLSDQPGYGGKHRDPCSGGGVRRRPG